MTGRIIDGVALAAKIREEVATRTTALIAAGTKPGLAVVLVGSDPASQVYVKNKVAACQKAGLHSILEAYPESMTQDELLARVKALNTDPKWIENATTEELENSWIDLLSQALVIRYVVNK